MSNTKSDKSKQNELTAGDVAAKIKELLNGADGFVLVGTIDPEVSAVTEDNSGTLVREFIPLGQGIHFVFSANLPTNYVPGIHEV